MKYETPRNFYSNNSKLLILLLGELHLFVEVTDGSIEISDVSPLVVQLQIGAKISVINLQSGILQLKLLVFLLKVILVELQVPDVDAELHDFLAVLLHGAADSIAEADFVRRNVRHLGCFPGRHFSDGASRSLGARALARKIGSVEILQHSCYKGETVRNQVDLPSAWNFLVSAIVAYFIKGTGLGPEFFFSYN